MLKLYIIGYETIKNHDNNHGPKDVVKLSVNPKLTYGFNIISVKMPADLLC